LMPVQLFDIAQALRSLERQTLPIEQVVVIDDGSTDDTATIVRQQFPGVHYRYQTNQGVGAARNLGLQLATGNFVAFLDADDYYLPAKLEKQVRVLERHPEVQMVFGHIQQFHCDSLSPARRAGIRCPPEPVPAELPSTLLGRRSVFDRVGSFETRWRVGADTSWIMRARDAGIRSHMLPDTVYMRRLHARNNGNTRSEDLGDRLHILKAMLDRRRREAAKHG